MLGHNRFKTRGEVNKENAHPFAHNNIIGVHNGTLRSVYNLPDHTKFDVDSDNIMYALSKMHMRDLYSKLNGALALVWWDKEHQHLHFIRNDERPMHMCFSQNKKQLFWASERGMLAAALARNNIAHHEIIKLEEDTLATFKIPGRGREFDAPMVETLVPFERTVYTYKGTKNTTTTSQASGYNNKNKGSGFYSRTQQSMLTRMDKGEEVEFTLEVGSKPGRPWSFLGFDDSGNQIVFSFNNFTEYSKFEPEYGERYTAKVIYDYADITVDARTVTPVTRADRDDFTTITQDEFNKWYGNCCWCQSELKWEDDNTYLSQIHAICPTCSKDVSVTNNLKYLIK